LWVTSDGDTITIFVTILMIMHGSADPDNDVYSFFASCLDESDNDYFNPFLSIKKNGLDILLTGYNNLTLQTY
jgi:hypothetical protein